MINTDTTSCSCPWAPEILPPVQNKGELLVDEKVVAVEDLTLEIKNIQKEQAYKDYLLQDRKFDEYKDEFTCGMRAQGIFHSTFKLIVTKVLLIVAALVIITIVRCLIKNQFNWCDIMDAFVEGLTDFTKIFGPVNIQHLTIGLSVVGVLSIGAGIVIHRAITAKEKLLAPDKLRILNKENGEERLLDPESLKTLLNPKNVEGTFAEIAVGEEIIEFDGKEVGSPIEVKVKATNIEWERSNDAPGRGNFCFLKDKLESVIVMSDIWDETDQYLPAYVDKSTLDRDGNGRAFLYLYKKALENHYEVGRMALIATPFYLVGTIIYNILRCAVLPFYVAFKCLQQCVSPEKIKGHYYTAGDIVEQMALSIKRILVAPFYATAYFFAILYSFVNPMGGRKLAGAIEYDWNEEVGLEEGYWSIGGWQSKSRRPENPFRNSFYLTGCHRPIGIVVYENHKIKTSYRMDATYDDGIPLNDKGQVKEVPFKITECKTIEKKVIPGGKERVNYRNELWEKRQKLKEEIEKKN